ncbi:AAA family ATPase [Nonomuraea sp. NPDC050783]|uniref:AAA family ATPase n=1 Tax=Nonomuraea sp. NPDC050783 TaxID=3154634 RepID=UPI003465C8C9
MTGKTESPALLTGIEVRGLLGQFDHNVSFDPDYEFIILHGPNGVGKTTLLELISAIFNLQTGKIIATPFDSARLLFSDGASLTVDKTEQLTLPDISEDHGDITLYVNLVTPAGKEYPWRAENNTARMDPAFLRFLERDTSFKRMPSGLWRDRRTGRVADIKEIADRYGIPRSQGIPSLRDVPIEIREYLDSINVHLIETQRLLSAQRTARKRPLEEGELNMATVIEFSEDLAKRFRDELAKNSRISQQLDKQFPRQLLHGGSEPPDDATEENIRSRYDEQGILRRRLSDISLLDTSDEIPLPEGTMPPWQRLVLWNYLNDTETKLKTFESLLKKIDLLQDIVDSRFLQKKLVIDREQGLRFKTSGGTLLHPGQLSSGEQHELVLIYELLFNADPYSLVLIDEPEISLHVTWQQAFMGDLIKIASLVPLRFIVATHSPQIVHTWRSRMIPLLAEDR